MRLLTELGNRRRIADCLAGLAALDVAGGKASRAAKLYGVVEAMRDFVGPLMSPPERAEYESTRAAAVAALGDEEFGRAFQAGRVLGPTQGIDLARQSLAASTSSSA